MLLGLVAPFGRAAQTRLGEEEGDALAGLGTHLQPMLDPLFVELHPVRALLGQHGIVNAQLLDEAPVAGHARFGDDDAVVGPLLGAAAGEANLEGHPVVFLSLSMVEVGWLFGLVAAGFDRVTLGVDDEGAVVVRMVLATEAGLAVVLAAGLDRRLVEGVDGLARLCREGDMAAG